MPGFPSSKRDTPATVLRRPAVAGAAGVERGGAFEPVFRRMVARYESRVGQTAEGGALQPGGAYDLVFPSDPETRGITVYDRVRLRLRDADVDMDVIGVGVEDRIKGTLRVVVANQRGG